MKKFLYSILFFFFTFLFIPSVFAKETVRIYLFHSDTCPHCAEERKQLEKLKKQYDYIEVYLYEVSSPENASLALQVMDALQVEEKDKGSVPFTVIGSKYFSGYNTNVGFQIEDAIRYYGGFAHKDVVGEILGIVPPFEGEENPNGNLSDAIKVPLLGEVNPKDVSLPILAVILGFIDGLNPCAMWILLFLISIMLTMHNRKRMWILGLTFLGTSAFVYLLFMIAWLNIAIKMNEIVWIRLIISIIALIAGTLNVNSFFKAREDGCTVTNDKQRRKIMDRIRQFTSEKCFLFAILGIMVLAFLVNLLELACSAGLPLLFTQVLSLNSLSTFQYGFYIFLYIFFFLIDDLAIFLIAMFTLKVTSISTKYTKWSHLIGGLLMILIAALMILKPEWLMFNF